MAVSGVRSSWPASARKRRSCCSEVSVRCREYASVALRALQDAGLRVPEDVAVVGADDLLIGRLLRPKLTTVRMDFAPAREIAEAPPTLLRRPAPTSAPVW
ncbi:substrate-binding domain-containing protein [Streptomyces sp. NPDC056390]|uniref:substrate-binding domain-containing protein n=1 Tax=Streptomyces sp. NPDC056390 TaxID=3345806 RepID=UPI0035DDF1C1